MNGETEMCDLMEVIFENEEASKYTSILTAEDYDTIGDLAFTFDRPPSEEQMEKELEEIGLDGKPSDIIIDSIMYIFLSEKNVPLTQVDGRGRKKSTYTRPLGRVRFELGDRTFAARILGDTSIQDRNGRIYGAVSEWLQRQQELADSEEKDDTSPPKAPELNGESLSMPSLPPPAAPDAPFATSS